MAHVYDRYLRQDKLPHIWCSGCGNGIVTNALIRAVDKAGIDPDQVVVIAGVGCSSRANGYLNFCGLHTNHGRPLAYATGVKMANPKLHVIVVTGDATALLSVATTLFMPAGVILILRRLFIIMTTMA
jgi:2-oxoglutarate ferredoxin oxidoreductase subunit beta|nr:thiamine pyrophosphate-dependent enzyme [uncultured Megasphaera sp.]